MTSHDANRAEALDSKRDELCSFILVPLVWVTSPRSEPVLCASILSQFCFHDLTNVVPRIIVFDNFEGCVHLRLPLFGILFQVNDRISKCDVITLLEHCGCFSVAGKLAQCRNV